MKKQTIDEKIEEILNRIYGAKLDVPAGEYNKQMKIKALKQLFLKEILSVRPTRIGETPIIDTFALDQWTKNIKEKMGK